MGSQQPKLSSSNRIKTSKGERRAEREQLVACQLIFRSLRPYFPPEVVNGIVRLIIALLQKPPSLCPIAVEFKNNYRWNSNIKLETHESTGLAVGKNGHIFLSDCDFHRISVFSSTGHLLSSFGTEGSKVGQFNRPFGLAVDRNFNIVVCDYGNNRIQIFNTEHQFLRMFGLKAAPRGVAITKTGNILITQNNNSVSAYSSSGKFIFSFGSEGTGDGQFDHPYGISTDNSDNIIIVDRYNHRIQIFDSEGLFLKKMDGSELNPMKKLKYPWFTTVDQEGNIAVTDENIGLFCWVRVGDLLLVLEVMGKEKDSLTILVGLAIDGNGNLLISDSSRICIFGETAK